MVFEMQLKYLIGTRIENRPTDWERLEQMYDAGGEYRKKYLDDKNSSAENKSARK